MSGFYVLPLSCKGIWYHRKLRPFLRPYTGRWETTGLTLTIQCISTEIILWAYHWIDVLKFLHFSCTIEITQLIDGAYFSLYNFSKVLRLIVCGGRIRVFFFYNLMSFTFVTLETFSNLMFSFGWNILIFTYEYWFRYTCIRFGLEHHRWYSFRNFLIPITCLLDWFSFVSV